jgi:hypothetical protein
MADLMSRKARFDEVKRDMNALMFHKNRYENGSVDALAKQCFQQWQLLKHRTTYEVYMDEMEAKANGTITKS